jgi:hypothetical protein
MSAAAFQKTVPATLPRRNILVQIAEGSGYKIDKRPTASPAFVWLKSDDGKRQVMINTGTGVWAHLDGANLESGKGGDTLAVFLKPFMLSSPHGC